MKIPIRVTLLVAAFFAAVVPQDAEAGCCKHTTTRTIFKGHTSCKVGSNKTAANNGKIGVQSPRKGPDSFLGIKFGASWPSAVDAREAAKGVVFKPKKTYRDFDRYSAVLSDGLVREVVMEHDFGSKETAEAEMRVCQLEMEKKYGCIFNGSGSRRRAVCSERFRTSPVEKGGSKMVERPVMELSIALRGPGTVRISAKSLDERLFTKNIRKASSADLDAL